MEGSQTFGEPANQRPMFANGKRGLVIVRQIPIGERANHIRAVEIWIDKLMNIDKGTATWRKTGE
jgi:hypothetical protein